MEEISDWYENTSDRKVGCYFVEVNQIARKDDIQKWNNIIELLQPRRVEFLQPRKAFYRGRDVFVHGKICKKGKRSNTYIFLVYIRMFNFTRVIQLVTLM